MTTREAIYKTALEHIRDGSDAVCVECGWTGLRLACRDRKHCPQCGYLVHHGHRHIADYALAQGEKGE